MGILPSKESHEYPGAFHFAQSGCHAMAILPLTEHFFPSVDSLAFRQLYACRDMQSAKYNFSLVSPQIFAKYRQRSIEQQQAKAANGSASVAPPADRWKPRPCLAHHHHSDDSSGDAGVADQPMDAAETTTKWVEVDTINADNFSEFFRTDTRCISPEESEWPFPDGDEEFCGELQHPNPSAHWRTHDAVRQYVQMESRELALRNADLLAAGASGNRTVTAAQGSTPTGETTGLPHEAVDQFAAQEREIVDKFFSRSPEALYNALVVEPNEGFLVDTNKEMCEIYAAEMRWKAARKIVQAYRQQCKKDGVAADASHDDEKQSPACDPAHKSEDAEPQPQHRITKQEADEAATVPPPPVFLRPPPQVIVVRIHREEEEAARAKYLAEQQRQQRRHRGSTSFEEETTSAGSRSARSRATSAHSPASESGSGYPMRNINTTPPRTPTQGDAAHPQAPSTATTRHYRFEDDDRYKDGRIHLVEEDGVLYLFAYNTAYVDPRQKLKERKQRRDEQRCKPMDPLEPRVTPPSSAAGDDDGCDDAEAVHAAETLAHKNRQTSSFYHTVDAFGSEESDNAPLEGALKKSATPPPPPLAAATVAATTKSPRSHDEDGSSGNNDNNNNRSRKEGWDEGEEDDDDGMEDEETEEEEDTAFATKRGDRGRQQDTAVFVDDAAPCRPQEASEAAAAGNDGEEEESEKARNDESHPQARHTSTSGGSESTTTGVAPTGRPREVQQLQLCTAAPFILPICPVRVVGCNGYTESTCRGTPWLRGYDDDPEEDAYVESLPVRPPVMSGGGFIDANIGDKILSRAFLLGLQVFRNVCLDAGLPETLTRPFWTLGLLSNIPLLQISREMRFRMRAAAAEVRLGFQELRDMIKGTENDIQSYIYGYSDILPYLECVSRARLQAAAAEEGGESAEEEEAVGETGERKASTTHRPAASSLEYSEKMLHPLLIPENNEYLSIPTRASQPVVQRSLRLPRGPIEFYSQLSIRGNQFLSRVRTESQVSFFHLIAEATAPVSTSLFMKPLELNMYDYGGAVRLHLIKNRVSGKVEMQALPPPRNLDQLIHDHQRRVQLRRLAEQAEEHNSSNSNDNKAGDAAAPTPTTAVVVAGANKPAEEEGLATAAKPGVRKSAKEKGDTAMPPYLIFTVVHPSAAAKGPSLEHYQRIMLGPDEHAKDGADNGSAAVDLSDVELMSLCDPAATGATTDGVPATRCTCYAVDGKEPQPVFAVHQYLYDDGTFVDGDMVVYNVHAGRWEHFEYFHREQIARRRALRERQKQRKSQTAASQADGQPSESFTSAVAVQDGGDDGNTAAEDLSDEDEEDIHQEDILLCWIKRRLQSATMRNRQDPGWLRDSEDHIVQEGRYYIWGFEHDDQRYFYGLIPKFAKEKKAKRHNNDKVNARMTPTSLNSHHHRRHLGGGSSLGTPSALSISPNTNHGSVREMRRLPIGSGRYSSGAGGNSGRYYSTNSPGSRSAHSSLSTRSPRNYHNSHTSGGGGVDLSSGDYPESGSVAHVQADAQLVVSFPDSRTLRAQPQQLHSPVSTNSPIHNAGVNAANNVSRRAMRTTDVDSASGKGSNNNNAGGSAVRPNRAGPQKPPPKVSAFLASAAAQSAAATAAMSEVDGPAAASSQSPGLVSANKPYPPRIVSAPLQSTVLKGTMLPSTAAAGAGLAPASAAGNMIGAAVPAGASHSLVSASTDSGARGRGGRQQQRQQQQQDMPFSLAPTAPQSQQQPQPQQQQSSDYAPVAGRTIRNTTYSKNSTRRGPAEYTGNASQQQQQQQPYLTQRGGPSMNNGNSNTSDWCAARGTSSDHGLPPPPPPPPPPIGPTEGGNYDNGRGYVNASPLQQQQTQQPHLHPPTVYMTTGAIGLHGNTQQQQQHQQQVPQPRRAQQQQQGPLPQMGPQGYSSYNPPALRQPPLPQQQQQQPRQMSMTPGLHLHGGNLSPPPPQPRMPTTAMGDAFPQPSPPPAMSMSIRRHPNTTNNNNAAVGGGPGMYMDPSNYPTPASSAHPTYYADVPPPPPPPQQQQQCGNGGGYYAAPSQPTTTGLSYGLDMANSSLSGGDVVQQGYPHPHPQQQYQQQPRGGMMPGADSAPPPQMARQPGQQPSQQPYHNAGASMKGHVNTGVYGDTAGMAPPLMTPPPQQQQQQQTNLPMRATTSMPQQQPMGNTAAAMSNPSQQQQQMMSINANPPYLPRQLTGNAHLSTALPPSSTNRSSAGELVSMYSHNSSALGPAGASSTSSNPSNGNAATAAAWEGPGLTMQYSSNNSNSNSVPTPNPAGAGRAGGKTPYPVQSAANAYPQPASMNAAGAATSAPLRPTTTGALVGWGPVSNTVSNRASPMQQQQQQQQQGSYPSPARDAGYAHDSYNTTAAGTSSGGDGNRLSTSPYPQPSFQQQFSTPSAHSSSYAPTPLPPPQHGGPVESTGVNSVYVQQPNYQRLQQQPSSPYPVQGGNPPHHASTHNNPYSRSVTASPALSHASHPSAALEPSPPQQQQQQHPQYPSYAGNNSNNGYGGGSTSPPAQQESVQLPHTSPTSATRAGSHLLNTQVPVLHQQQHLVTPTGGTSTFAHHASGSGGNSGFSGSYAASSTAPASRPPPPQPQQLPYSIPSSPSPSGSSFSSAALPQVSQKLSPSANASGTLLRSSSSPQQRQFQQLQQQRHQQQQQQQQGGGMATPSQPSHNVRQSPAPQLISEGPLQQHPQQHRSGDSYGESGSYDATNSPGQLPRFAHNPYAMQ